MTTTTAKARKGRKPYDGPTAEEKLCSALVELLEKGVNPWRRDWSQLGQQGQHRNLLTGAAYRGSNPAVLEMWSACRGFSLPLWLGSAQAKGEGWFPRKGSSGCYVLRPQLNKREQQDETGKPVKGPDGQPLISAWVSFKPVCVFNVADLVGSTPEAQQALEARISQALGSVVVRPEPERLAAAEAVLGAWPVPTTWASTGHSSRLGRDLSGSHGSEAYAREELVAELAAFLICNRLQISSSTENHAAYLGCWARVLKAGPRVLFKALGDASKATAAICGPDVTEDDA
jgi:antirestriction protein ArdC